MDLRARLSLVKPSLLLLFLIFSSKNLFCQLKISILVTCWICHIMMFTIYQNFLILEIKLPWWFIFDFNTIHKSFLQFQISTKNPRILDIFLQMKLLNLAVQAPRYFYRPLKPFQNQIAIKPKTKKQLLNLRIFNSSRLSSWLFYFSKEKMLSDASFRFQCW